MHKNFNVSTHLLTSEVLDALGDAGYLSDTQVTDPEQFARMQSVIREITRKALEEAYNSGRESLAAEVNNTLEEVRPEAC